MNHLTSFVEFIKLHPSLSPSFSLSLSRIVTLRNLLSRTLDIAIRTRLYLWRSHSGSLAWGDVRNAAIFAVESPEFVLSIVGVVDGGNGEGDI